MDFQRNIFIISFLIMSFILWQTWQIESDFKTESKKNQYENKINSAPSIDQNEIINNNNKNLHNEKNKHFFTIKTDIFLLKINTYGGDIEEAYLLKYLETSKSNKIFQLLKKTPNFTYQIHSGLINENLQDNPANNSRLLYVPQKKQDIYELQDCENELKLNLIYKSIQGITYIKQYIFKRGNYSIQVNYHIINMSNEKISIKLFGDLVQSINQPKSNNNFSLYDYHGTAYSTDKKKYQKYSFRKLKNTDLHIHSLGGWIAIPQKYFATAWLPLTEGENSFYTTLINKDKACIKFESSAISILPNHNNEMKSILWLGPKIQKKMKETSQNLDLLIDYGWLWFISHPLFKLLYYIYNYVNNWGLAIIIITLIIRLVMYPLTKAQYISMAKIKMLQPKLTIIQEKFKHDKYQYHQAVLSLYKTEKVNPLGGCLPILIQMPIFLALYYMLSGSVELRHAKFIFWIQDLSEPDPYYILPIIMGISMFLIQKISPTTISDSIQKKIMIGILIAFTIFFLWFPSGLVLYYVVSNIITIIQQQIIYNNLKQKNNKIKI